MLSSAAWQPCGGSQWLTSWWGCHTAWSHCGVGFARGMGTGLSPSPPGESQAVQCRGGPFPSGPRSHRALCLQGMGSQQILPQGSLLCLWEYHFSSVSPKCIGFHLPRYPEGNLCEPEDETSLGKARKKKKKKRVKRRNFPCAGKWIAALFPWSSPEQLTGICVWMEASPTWLT